MMSLGGLVLKRNIWAIIGLSIIVMIGMIGIMIHNYTKNSVDYFVRGIELQQDYYLDDELIENYTQLIGEKLEYVKSRGELKKAYCWMGYLYFFSSDYRASNEYFLKALAIEKQVSDELQVMLYMGVSNNYYMLGELENSQEYYEKAQIFAIEKGNELLLADVYQTRALLYKNSISRLDVAVNLLWLSLYLEANPIRVIEIDLMMTEICLLKEDFEGMLYYLQQAWVLAEEYDQQSLSKYTLYLASIAYYFEGQYERTIQILQHLNQQAFNYDSMGSLYFLAYSYYQLEGYEKAVSVLERYRENEGQSLNLYCDLVMIDLLMTEGQYDQAKERLVKLEVNGHSKLWKRLLELKLMQYLELEIDLLTEYESLLHESRFSLVPSISLYFIYATAQHYFSYSESTEIFNLEDFNLNEESLKEPSFDEFHEMIALKVTSRLYKKRLVLGVSFVGGLVLIGSILYHVIVTRNLKKKLEYQIQMDPLTETMSYEWLHEEVSFIRGSHSCCQLMLFDLESFHKYNETYGYLAGNYVLRRTAYLLKNEFKDGWVIRYNGHQFLVVMLNQQESMDNRMKQAIEAFRALQIQFVTGLSKGQLLIRASGSCRTLTKDFNLDSCLKEMEQRLQYLKHGNDGNYIN